MQCVAVELGISQMSRLKMSQKCTCVDSALPWLLTSESSVVVGEENWFAMFQAF